MGLAHKLDGRWIEVGGGGGAIDVDYLFRLGVPERLIRRLLSKPHYQPSAAKIHKAAQMGPVWPETSKQRLTEDRLANRTLWELLLMRNEIFARHGRSFQDPELVQYFASRRWYRKNPAYSDNLLSEIERYNAKFIASYMEDHKSRKYRGFK